MTTAAKLLSPAEKKQLLKAPLDWVRKKNVRVGKRALTELLESRRCLLESAEAVTRESRNLSKAIGEAKKLGEPADALLQQKKMVSAREKSAREELKQLDARLVELLTPIAAINDVETTGPAGYSIDVEAVEIAELMPGEEGVWDAFVKQHSRGTAYHLTAMRKVIEETFGHQTRYLIARASDNAVGVLPLVRLTSRLFGDFIVSQPYFNYGGALALSETVAAKLMDAAQSWAHSQGCSHIEYRDREAVPDLPVRTDKVAMWLQLPDSEQQLWRQIGTKVRAQVKRGGRHELEIQSGNVELLDDFYRVFAENMRDLGTPVYDKSFFRNLLESSLADMRLIVVRRRGKTVSAAFLLGYGQRMEVPWASTLRSANRYDANMFLYWELLRQACASGYKVFDFGRSTRDAPTYRFKKQWGAAPVQLHWHYWLRDADEPPKINPDNPKYRLAIAAWQRLPVWFTRLLGPGIVKYLP